MARTKRVSVELRGKETVSKASKKASDSVRGLGDELDSTQKKTSGFGETLKTAFSVAAIVAGTRAVVNFGRELAEVSRIQQDAIGQLNAATRNNALLDGSSVVRLQQFASELQGISTIGDEVTISFAGMLGSFGRSEEEIRDIISAAADLSAATGMSLDSAVRNLNKTFGGLSGELGELLPEMKDLTREQLEAGDAVELVSRQFEGMAEQMADMDSGSIAQFNNAWGDTKEILGDLINSAIRPLRDELTDLMTDFNNAVNTMRAVEDLDFSQLSADATTEQLQTQLANAQALLGALEQQYEDAERRMDRFAERNWVGQQIFANQNALDEAAQPQRSAEIQATQLLIESIIRRLEEAGVEPASPTAAGPGSGAGRGGASQYTQAVNEAISRVAQAFNTAQIQKTVWGDFIDVNEEVSDSMKSAFEQLSEFTGPDGPFNPDSPGIQRFLQTMEQEFPDAFAAFSGAVQGVTQNVEDQSDLLQEQLTAGSGGGGAAAGAGPGADLMAGFRQTLTDAGNYVSENLNGFAGELATAAMQAGAYGVAMVAVNTVMAGFFEQMNPILNDVLAPLQDALTQMGRILASTLIPIMNRLAPVFEVIGNVILANFASMIELITPGLEILGAVLAILTPIIQTAATVFEILTAPLRFLADLLEYVGKVIRHAIGEITFWTSRDNTSAPGSFRSDAFSGLEDRIRRIWDVDTPDYADGVPGDSSASSSTGDNTRVSRPPDIHIYQTFQGPVIGEAGKAQVGEFMAEAMIAYAGIGGRIIFEDAEGNQFTLAAEG